MCHENTLDIAAKWGVMGMLSRLFGLNHPQEQFIGNQHPPLGEPDPAGDAF